MDTLLLVLGGLLVGGAWSARTQGAPGWLVVVMGLAAVLSVVAALVSV